MIRKLVPNMRYKDMSPYFFAHCEKSSRGSTFEYISVKIFPKNGNPEGPGGSRRRLRRKTLVTRKPTITVMITIRRGEDMTDSMTMVHSSHDNYAANIKAHNTYWQLANIIKCNYSRNECHYSLTLPLDIDSKTGTRDACLELGANITSISFNGVSGPLLLPWWLDPINFVLLHFVLN